MPLSSLVAAVAAQLADELADAVPVGTAPAVADTDLPLITVSIEAAPPAGRGLGLVPGPVRTGALRVEVEIDLADAALHFPGETVALLSPDRRTLLIPHGAVVRADGVGTPPFGPDDLLTRVGATPFTPVHTTPGAGQVRLDVEEGRLTFPAPLPATGTVGLGYFLPVWEERAERFSAAAHLDISTDSQAALDALVPQVERALALHRIPADRGIRRIEPVALGAAAQVLGLPPAARRQRLTYQVDFELVEPVVPTSGGPVKRIEVTIQPFGESFTIVEGTQP